MNESYSNNQVFDSTFQASSLFDEEEVPENTSQLSVTDNAIEEELNRQAEDEVLNMTADHPIIAKIHNLYSKHLYYPTDLGCGELYADLYKDEIRFNVSDNRFSVYQKDIGTWGSDVAGMAASRKAKILIKALEIVWLGGMTGDYMYRDFGGESYAEMADSYIPYILRLETRPRRNAILKDARDKYAFSDEDTDKNPSLSNMKNGVLDLANGNRMMHSPDYLITKVAGTEYDETASCAEWERFINDIMLGDNDKIIYLQKALGSALDGRCPDDLFHILYGPTTRNGKTTLIDVIAAAMGDYSQNLSPDSLAVKSSYDGRRTNEDIAALKGARYVFVNEPQRNMRLDAALVKAMTGGDMLSARRVREHQFEFKPQFKMFMNTNYLPRIEDPTLFSSGRVRVITFDRHFDEDEQDKNLAARLKRPENLPGVMKWLVDGYFMYKDEGLKPPRCVILATREYEEASDMYANFIDSVLIKEDTAIIPAGSAYAVFERWCKEEQYPHVKKKEFFAELRKRGLIKDTGTVEGKTKRNVITGYRIDQGAFKASAL